MKLMLPLPRWERIEVRVVFIKFYQVIFPLPFIPSHEGRGDSTFYKTINYSVLIFLYPVYYFPAASPIRLQIGFGNSRAFYNHNLYYPENGKFTSFV